MSRPSGEARRQELLDEAIRQIGQKGFDATSLDAIAGAAGVRKQTLLYYFDTKQALLEAAVQEVSARVAATLDEALAQTRTNRAVAVIRAVFHLAKEWPEFPAFVREAGRLGPETVEDFARNMEPLRRRAVDYLQEEMDAGRIRKQDPAMLLFTLYTSVVGSITEAGVLHAVVGEDSARTTLKRREREVIAFVRHALEPPPGG